LLQYITLATDIDPIESIAAYCTTKDVQADIPDIFGIIFPPCVLPLSSTPFFSFSQSVNLFKFLIYRKDTTSLRSTTQLFSRRPAFTQAQSKGTSIIFFLVCFFFFCVCSRILILFWNKIEQVDEDKNTPLGIGLMYGHPSVAIVLIEKGANVHHPLTTVTYHTSTFFSPHPSSLALSPPSPSPLPISWFLLFFTVFFTVFYVDDSEKVKENEEVPQYHRVMQTARKSTGGKAPRKRIASYSRRHQQPQEEETPKEVINSFDEKMQKEQTGIVEEAKPEKVRKETATMTMYYCALVNDWQGVSYPFFCNLFLFIFWKLKYAWSSTQGTKRVWQWKTQ
jgi:hypothetical protein